MCHLSIAVDRSIGGVTPVFDAIEASNFFIRSIRVLPVAWSEKADVQFSLGGGGDQELHALLIQLKTLPCVLSTHHVAPPV